jgi:hypothetical protein
VKDILKDDLGEMLLGSHGVFPDRQLLKVIIDNVVDVEMHRSRNRIAKRRGTDSPPRCEPARGALHAHAELGEPGAIGGYGRRPECTRKFGWMDSGGVVADRDSSGRAQVKIDIDAKLESFAFGSFQFASVLKEALHSIVNELS